MPIILFLGVSAALYEVSANVVYKVAYFQTGFSMKRKNAS